MSEANPMFGRREPGQDYQPRPGSYAVIRNVRGEIGVVQTPQGCYLPGGGADAGETPEQTLRREVREECAAEIHIGNRLGTAIEFVFAPGEGHFEKICTFFEASIIEIGSGAIEYRVIWLPAREAIEALRHESHRWAVGRLIPFKND